MEAIIKKKDRSGKGEGEKKGKKNRI